MRADGLFVSGVMTCLLLGAAVNMVSAEKPDVISLPTGFFPEGITIGEGWTAYVGSLADGSIWKGNLKTGEGQVVVSPSGGTQVVGLAYDKRSNYLFACGGPSGTVRVYDKRFDLVAEVLLGETDGSSGINDVIVTNDAAYFTDSFQPHYYKLPLDKDTGELDAAGVETISLSVDFVHFEGEYNSNGIEASADGESLIIINFFAGMLYKVNAATGEAVAIDLGGDVIPDGDGLVLRGTTLWVVQNGYSEAVEQITEVSLSADFSCGFVSPRVLTSDIFDFPTTAAYKDNALYAVNAKWTVAEEDVAATDYEILRLDRDDGEFVCAS